MSLEYFYSATLGLSSPWKVSAISFSDTEPRVDIAIDLEHGYTPLCPCCGGPATISGTDCETWHRHDFFQYAAYLHVRVPILSCSGEGCGNRRGDGPWTREHTKFVLLE